MSVFNMPRWIAIALEYYRIRALFAADLLLFRSILEYNDLIGHIPLINQGIYYCIQYLLPSHHTDKASIVPTQPLVAFATTGISAR